MILLFNLLADWGKLSSVNKYIKQSFVGGETNEQGKKNIFSLENF